MNRGFYTKLAWTGITKNKQLYYPYLIASITMVMVFYILDFLSISNIVHNLPGGETITLLFDYGAKAIAIFSVPFLFYTNSSLIKKRKKELGLYNILGMNKQNIFSILFWEALITYAITMAIGIFIGIIFSKIAELGIVNIMGKQVNYLIYVEWKAVLTALCIFAIIFFLILLNMLRQIHNNNPIELLHSESEGERPPKSHWLLAIISLILILSAYFWSINMRYSIQALQNCFFIAGLITVGTFLLFICTSVFLCKLLKNNKRYYYKTSHFITVSSMSYRMKRNGASLASICILIVLILVTLTFSIAFYAGAKKTIEDHYPYDCGISVEIPSDQIDNELFTKSYTINYQSKIDNIIKNSNMANDLQLYSAYSANMLALIVNGHLDLSKDIRNTWFEPGIYDGWEREEEKIVLVRTISLAEYNKLCKTSVKLNNNEVLIATKDINYQSSTITLYNNKEIKVAKTTTQIPKMTTVLMLTNVLKQGDFLDTKGIEQIFLIVPNLYSFIGREFGSSIYSKANYLTYWWEYDIDMKKENIELNKIYSIIEKQVKQVSTKIGNSEFICYLKAEKSERFYGLAGGILFLMIIINIVFVFVTALIMYYKQISEGYEDQKRFAIMRKIGITKKEIKKVINSQILTIFWLPLLIAGFHLAFTSQIVYLLLRYAVLDDKALVIKVMLISYILFAIVYSVVYILTSKIYFKIVNRTTNN